VHEGDIVTVVSDGVHDNLDPQMLGVAPADVGLTIDSWNDAHSNRDVAVEVEDTKRTFMLDLLLRITSMGLKEVEAKTGTPAHLTPDIVTQSLIRHARAITSSVRAFMENNPAKKQPKCVPTL
jgi:hypothetical protein